MEVYLEVLLEMIFSTKPLNFGVEAYMMALAGVALTKLAYRYLHTTYCWLLVEY
jgi:hypothetical protein